jgi:hypothetical protein
MSMQDAREAGSVKQSIYRQFGRMVMVMELLLAGASGAQALDATESAGTVQLSGPVHAARASLDGRLLVVELEGRLIGGHSALVVIDTSDLSRPRALVEMPLPGTGQLALSPDGRTVLLALNVTAPGLVGFNRFELMTVDLSRPDAPAVTHDETVATTDATVSPRAGLFAYGPPADQPRRPPWRLTVKDRDGRVVAAIDADHEFGFLGALGLSPDGEVLVAMSVNDVRAWRLDMTPPRAFTQSRSDGEHFCAGRVPQATDSGRILLGDCATSRLGVYALEAGLPRQAILQEDQRGLRDEALDPNDADAGPTLFWAFDQLLQIDLRAADVPVLRRLASLPAGLTPIAAAQGQLAVVDSRYRLSWLPVPHARGDAAANPDAPAAASAKPDPAAGIDEPCGALAAWANAGRLDELVSNDARDLPWRGRRIDLNFVVEGSAHVPAWHGFDSSTDEPVPDDDLPTISNADGLWSFDNVNLLTYRGRHYLLHDRGPRYPVEAASIEDPGAACRFEVEVVETPGPKVGSPRLCADVQAGRIVPAPVLDTRGDLDDVPVQQRWPQSGIDGTLRIAFANDGIARRVVRIGMANGANGCGPEFLDLLEEDGSKLAEGPLEKQLLALQRISNPKDDVYRVACSHQSALFRWHGQVYADVRPTDWPPSARFDEYHYVTTLRHGRAFEMCDFHFRTVVTAHPSRVEPAKQD